MPFPEMKPFANDKRIYAEDIQPNYLMVHMGIYTKNIEAAIDIIYMLYI